MANEKTRLKTASIFSIFSSFQGEGIYVGVPQIFVRFAGCNIQCDYCDTKEALSPRDICRIESSPFSDQTKLILNPLDTEMVVSSIKQLAGSFDRFHSISLTGGEPLLYSPFLKELLPDLKKIGLKILLETNGTLPKELKQTIDMVDIISMDIKIPYNIIKGRINWSDTEDFLKISSKHDCYVKIIVPELPNNADSKNADSDFAKACDLVLKINRKIPVVIQPAFNNNNKPTGLKRLLKIYQIFTQKLDDVRIIPQMHRLMGWS